MSSDVTTEPVERIVNGIPAARQEIYSFDATPYAVVHQGLLAVQRICPQLNVRRFLDPMAGAGVFGQAVRVVFGSEVLSIGIEVRAEEHENLKRHHDVVYIDRFQACAEIPHDLSLISTNPKFDEWPEVLPWALDRLGGDGVLALYGRTYWGHSEEGAERADLFRKHPPLYTLRVAGRVRHRVGRNAKGKPYGTDAHKYSWWVWDKSRPAQPGVRVQIDLPHLLPNELRFTAIPGTDGPDVEEDAAE